MVPHGTVSFTAFYKKHQKIRLPERRNNTICFGKHILQAKYVEGIILEKEAVKVNHPALRSS
jgi:hypothetical protein